jgi:hypothetical protein
VSTFSAKACTKKKTDNRADEITLVEENDDNYDCESDVSKLLMPATQVQIFFWYKVPLIFNFCNHKEIHGSVQKLLVGDTQTDRQTSDLINLHSF